MAEPRTPLEDLACQAAARLGMREFYCVLFDLSDDAAAINAMLHAAMQRPPIGPGVQHAGASFQSACGGGKQGGAFLLRRDAGELAARALASWVAGHACCGNVRVRRLAAPALEDR
jgi:hypothetical protein